MPHDPPPHRLPLASHLLPPPPTPAQVRREIWPTVRSYADRRQALFDSWPPHRWLDHLLGDAPQYGLVAVTRMLALARHHEERQVCLARGLGWSWDSIAFARGTRKQSLHQRYADIAPGRGSLTV